jgi:UDP-N-acetylmuramate dehydrogenase
MNTEYNKPLKELNTFGIDVKAGLYTEVHSHDELQSLMVNGVFSEKPHLILGGGSNILFTGDYPGLVIRLMLKGKKIIERQGDHVIIEARAGEDWDELVGWAIQNELGGLENLSLIPGQAGTAPIQNIGAYGVELKDCFDSLQALEKQSGKIINFTADECDFGYRYSIFKGPAKDRYIILSIRLRLTHTSHIINTSYGSISQQLESMGIQEPGIADVRQAVCAIRSSKLPDPKLTGNAGSFFKNPVIELETFKKIKKKHPEVIAFPFEEYVKLAAGWLIEKAGWKGFRRDHAGVHHQQALVLVNHGNATGLEILQLAQEIQQSVKDTFGVTLEPEVNIL